ncbi:MAG TPA: type II secretion system protein GspC [Woeseiaceae bacterium]|nr:type II secretion system protein GspC [Woeseiaceae bacterium]
MALRSKELLTPKSAPRDMTTSYRWSDIWSGNHDRAAAAANSLLPAWVSLVLAILIGWQLAKIVWMLVPGPAAGQPVEVPKNGAAVAPGGAADTDASVIASAHLFGEADVREEAAPPPAEHEALEETNLSNLKLRGTIASDRPEYSIAIIADGGNEEKVYAVGDPVASGASLHAVYPDRVVLNEQGALTNLSLPRDFGPSSASAYIAPTIPTLEEDYVEEEMSEDDESIQSVVAQNVSRLADVIRPTPYFVNGQQQGYRVYPGRDRDQFAALGLRPGDLIKDIDGQSLTDPQQAMEIFQSLGTADQVSVTVERDGNAETIVLRTDQLDLAKETH